MKNFNFKWLLLSIILSIASINAANATTYHLRYKKGMQSSDKDGNTSQQLTQFGSSNRYYCELSLDASSSYGFFIRVDNSNTKCWKANATASTNQEIQLYSYSGEHGNSNHRVSYTTGSAGTYIFTYDISNHKISVSPKSSLTIKVAWSVASGHDRDYNLGTYTTLSREGSTAKYSADVDMTNVKHYMFVQTDNNRYWKSANEITAGTYAYVYDYGTNNYGNSGDKLNFTPSAAGKYRFIWDHDAKMLTCQQVYSLTYNGNGSTSGSVPVAEAYYLSGTNVTVANNSGNLKKTGYVFVGWNTSSTGNGKYFPEGSTITTTAANTTLYAMWMQVHESAGVGNTYYGQDLTQVSTDYYEVYRYATASNTLHINAGTLAAPTTTGTRVVLSVAGCGSSTADSTFATTTWMAHSKTYGLGTGTATASGEFPSQATCNPGIQQGQGFIIVVSGYDQFSLYAKDANTSGDKQFHVYINNVDVTASPASGTVPNSSSYNIRRYDLTPGDVSVIRVQAHTNTSSLSQGFSLRVPAAECSATQPGALSKGTLSGCSRTITASGSAATNNTWYWQSSANGTDKSDAYSSGKAITEAGTYYLRSFCSDGSGCWSDAVQVTITAADMTPAAPSALGKSSITAKGVILAVTDAANTNDYEFYVSTSSSAPGGSTPATHSSNTKSLTITNLYAGTTFYAWARAKCGSNKSAWTALTGSTFTTSTVTVTHTLTNVTKTSGATTAGGSDYTAEFAAVSGYSMPTPTVTIGGNTATSGTDYTWNAGTGTITIPANKINGNIVITMNSVPSAPSSAVISGTYHYFPGDNISLTCTPSGNNGLTTYQWYKGGKADGNRIAGATSATYTKNSCAFEDAGSYYCKVTCNATSIWAVTNSHENYDVKILRLYVNGSKGGESYGNVDFVKVNSTTARASISLGSNWTYGFNIADGCGHYYGNYGTMQENNCTNWTTNVNGTDCGLTTTNAATYIFTINYSNLSSITTSVTFPVANQASGKVIYFDNNVLKWTGSSIYYRIGHSSHSQADQLSLVPGTANLYKMTTRAYNNFSAWHIANATGDVGSGKSIYKTVDGTPITKATAHEGGAVTQETITVTPTTSKGYGADVGVNNNCEFFNYTITSGMKTDRVTISPYSNGTITVNYTNTSGSAATLTSGNADLAHSVILTSITAVADEGYDASAITINDGAYSANYVVTGPTTIAASFTLKTYTISYNKGTNGTGSKASETKTHGVNFTLPGSTFTYGGHAQDGWSTSDGGALAYALSGSYTTNAAQEFFPHWKCNTPTITDNGNNTVTITVPSGTTVRYTTDGTDPSSSTGTVYSTTFSIVADCTVKAIAYQSNCTDSEIASQACDYTAPANFQMIADASAGSNATVSHNESLAQGSKNCSVLTGGTAKYVALDASTVMTVNKNNSNGQYGWYIQSSQSIVITLSSHMLQAGSVIYVQGNAASNNGITINGSTVLKNNTGAQGIYTDSYTVVAGDTHLVGKNVITITRSGDSRLQEIAISNCASGTPCVTPVLPSLTTPNQACTTGDFAAWDASVTNSAAISAASGSQAVSYSWKNSSSVEVATTASYTPSAAGTYTVTATVHSDASGYIDATATSSTLTASLYTATSIGTQPTTAVAAEEGENFTLGTGMVATGQGDLSYQWYSYTSSGGAGEACIGSATSATYTTSKAAAGTYYYKVKVTADCGTVASNMITVTVTEAPCFKASDLKKAASGWTNLASGATLDASTVVGTITGGTITNSGTDAIGANNSGGNGLVIEGSKEITVTLSGSHVLGSSSVITLTCAGNNTTSSHTSGFAISGLAMDPATEGPSTTSCNTFTQTFEVSGTVLEGSKSFKIALADGTSKTYLRSITVTGCEDCTPIDPELSYSKTTIWMDDADLTATPSLDKDGSTGTVSYALTSATPSGCVTLNTTTGVVTAVKRGTATITATIEADGTHCGKSVSSVITVKDMTCGWTVIAGVTATSKNSGTPEGSLIASSSGYKVNLQDWASPDGGCGTGGKIGGDNNYIYLTLKSGEYFQDGDKVIVDIAKVPGTGDSKLHIYDGTTTLSDESTMIGTSGTPTCGENEIVLSGVPANTSSITLHRGNGPTSATIQNPYVISMKVKRYVCPDSKEFLPTASSGNWNETANWIGSDGRGASLPTIDDRLVISKPVTIDIADAKAKDVLVNQYSGATGKITVSAGKALIIAEKMQKTTTGSNRIATAAADVIINSTRAAGTGALVMGSHDGSNAATVNFETKVKRESGTGNWINQFIGSPFSDLEPYVDYALQIYEFRPADDGNRGFWHKLSSGDGMEAFWGYNVLYNDNDYLDVQWTGTLNASSNNVTKTGSNEVQTDNLFANSWVAPIHIAAFEEDDFTNFDPTIYIFNAGTPQQEDAAGGIGSGTASASSAGTYAVLPIDAAPWVGMEVIPAMQAFFVKAIGASPSIKFDYSKLVYTPALSSVDITPTRAPRRSAEVAPEVIRLHVAGENGWAENTYVLGREDFTEGYDRGWDGRYMEGEDTNPQLYTPTTDGYMAVNCVPEIEGTVVGFRKGSSDNNYIFSFDYDGDEVWYLNDQKAQKSTQIMNGQTYAFVSEAGDNAARFVISATPINKIATGCESVGTEAAKVRKLIINDKVYIIRGGQVFDVLGKTIKK